MPIKKTVWASLIEERADVTPERGYNILQVDDFAPFGEKLTIVSHVATQAEADGWVANAAARGVEFFYYGSHDEVEDLAVEETVSIPSSLSSIDIGAIKTRKGLGEIEYPYDDQHKKNYVATGSNVDSQPSMHNEEGFVGSKQVPEWSYDIEAYRPQIQEALHPRPVNVPAANVSRYAKYTRTAHEYDDVCADFEGMIFDLKNEANRPVPPSEGRGYTTTHPNCKCFWEPQPDYKGKGDKMDNAMQLDNKHIRKHIKQAAKDHTLHTTWQDGHLSKRTRGTNPLKMTADMRPIREAILGLREEFQWMTPEYQGRVNNVRDQVGGAFFLIRASGETITDHRAEGDLYRRLLISDEIAAFTRTAITKGLDVNHMKEFRTSGIVMDGEYDAARKEMQLLVHERDPEIIAAVASGIINEVSINGGLPRTQDVDCSMGECFLVPRGVVLGELDGIALTYVVSHPQGMYYKGSWIAPKKAGVKTTAIEVL